MLVGGGVILAGAATAAAELARRCDMPAACTLMGLGALPTDDPLALGLIGMHGSRYANRLLEACDLLLAVGMRFDDRATGKVEAFCPQARVIHVDIDASELGKIKAPTLAVAADARLALEGLLERLAPAGRPAWRAAVERSRSAAPLLLPGAEDPRRPYGLIRTVGELLGPKGVVATDVGQHQMWVAQAYPFRAPRRWLTSGGLGTMGFGLPAAIGAALAEPEATVACFTGDGSLLMNIQELATLAEEDLNVKVILLDNRALGLVRQQQELFYGARFCASEFRAPTDFPTIAQGFGLPVCRLGEEADAEGALRGALTRAGPCLIHVPVERTEAVYPMVAPGAANSEMIGGEIHADATA
jgi:acetolactate synthase-1/2/3 large subunit